MGGGGGRINKPKAAVKRKKVKLVRKNQQCRSEETLADTTLHKLRQCRSNPHANVRLSGKKKRLLLKELKRAVTKEARMEVIEDSKEDKSNVTNSDTVSMDTTTTSS